MSPVARIKQASEGNATPITNALIVGMIVVSLSILTYVGKINGDAAISLFSAIIGALLARQSFSAGSKATSDPPPE
jgi:hypothetical protein